MLVGRCGLPITVDQIHHGRYLLCPLGNVRQDVIDQIDQQGLVLRVREHKLDVPVIKPIEMFKRQMLALLI